MMKRVCALLVTIALSVVLVIPAVAQDDANEAVLDYVLTMQNADGGFSNGWSPESDISTTADAIIAALALDANPEAFLTGDMMSPIGFLGVQVGGDAITGAGQLAKVLTAVVAVGKDWDVFAGRNLVDDLLAFQADDGVFGYGMFDHCLSVIGLRNAGVDLPGGAVEAVAAAQNEDGGWGFMTGEASDTNTTSLCLQALALLDVPDVVDAGLAYLAAIQNEDSGWPYQNPSDFGTASDTNSTALVIQALLATGEDLDAWDDPQGWLATARKVDGTYGYQPGVPGDVLSTLAAIPAAEGVWLTTWAPVPEPAE